MNMYICGILQMVSLYRIRIDFQCDRKSMHPIVSGPGDLDGLLEFWGRFDDKHDFDSYDRQMINLAYSWGVVFNKEILKGFNELCK